jgi:hypothetical protein
MVDEPDVVDPDAPPSEEEQAEATRLREALEDPARVQGGGLAGALSAAWSPRDLSAGEHRALLDRALADHALRRRRAHAMRVSFGAGLAALAAGVALVVGIGRGSPPTALRADAAFAPTRSTQSLFTEPFAGAGGQTARVDRIAAARAADLRENEFARWGVR